MAEAHSDTRGATVHLRAPEQCDRPALLGWRSDPQAQLDLMLRITHSDAAEVESWLARRAQEPDTDFRLIADARDDHAIGFVQLTHIDPSAQRAWLGLYVDPAARGTGAAAEALTVMERIARDEHRLHTIRLEVLAQNERALRFWRARGYAETELVRDHYPRGDRKYDVWFLEKSIEP